MSGSPTTLGYFKSGDQFYSIRESEDCAKETCLDELEKLNQWNALKGEYTHPSSGENVFPFNYGPSSGGMIESIDFKIYTYGERILSMDALPMYKKRNIKISGNTFGEGLLKIERMNGFHSFSYSTLLCRAIEFESSIQLDPSVIKTRVWLLEMERITSHIFKIARLCDAASQNIAAYWLLNLRERMQRLFAAYAGHRYLFGVNKIGGISRKIDIVKMKGDVEKIVNEFQDLVQGLYSSRIFIDRLDKTCETRVDFARGPVMRATKKDYDFRYIDPYYSGINFKHSTESGSDSLARLLVLVSEIESSLDIIKGEGEFHFDVWKKDDLKGPAVYSIETPSGDANLSLKTKDHHIDEIHLFTPSQLNLEAFCRGIVGNVKTDIPFSYESFGIWVSELGGVK